MNLLSFWSASVGWKGKKKRIGTLHVSCFHHNFYSWKGSPLTLTGFENHWSALLTKKSWHWSRYARAPLPVTSWMCGRHPTSWRSSVVVAYLLGVCCPRESSSLRRGFESMCSAGLIASHVDSVYRVQSSRPYHVLPSRPHPVLSIIDQWVYIDWMPTRANRWIFLGLNNVYWKWDILGTKESGIRFALLFVRLKDKINPLTNLGQTI